MEKPKVSVVVSIYNREDYIAGCLDKLIKQSLKNIKIVCVDDGSTDGSAKILKQYAKKDKRIVIVSKENGGLSSARNAGLKKCDTEYVMFCDSDDYYNTKMCEKMVNAIEKSQADLAICEIGVKYEAHKELKPSDDAYYHLRFSGKTAINENVARKTDVSACNKIFRMDVIKKYNINFPDGLNNEDYYFYNAYMSVSTNAYYVNEKLYCYVRHAESIMSDNFDQNQYSPDHLLVAEALFKFYKKNHFLEKHANLFWLQFTESFWFSYYHSAQKHQKRIQALAKKFISKNYAKYKPTSAKAKKEVSAILNNSLWRKAIRKAKSIARRIIR